MKVLVTGTAGFIGYHMVKYLISRGDEVVGLDSINDYYDVGLKYGRLQQCGVNREDISYGKEVNSSCFQKYRFVMMNLEDRENLEELFKKENFDSVCHLAAQAGVRYSIENPHAYIQSNIVGYLNILESCRHYPVKHLVYASSSSVYGANKKVPFSVHDSVDSPVSLYAATKKSNELMAYTYSHLYNIPVSGLRFFTVYGPWGRPDMAPVIFAKAINEDSELKVFNYGRMERDFTYIDDIVTGVTKVLDSPPSTAEGTPGYRLCNIGNSNPVNLMDFITTLESEFGKTAEKNMMPIQPGDVEVTWADCSDLEKEFGYKPSTPLKDGIKSFASWYREYYSF